MELMGNQTTVNMKFPVVLPKARKLGYKFMAAEAWWILTGQNTVSTIAPYSKQIVQFSDDGSYYHGAYGPKIVDQLSYVVESLVRDEFSRQAVINIWRESPKISKDIPCTVSLQFLIRHNRINCIATMRSSDAWLGWPYDVFNFSMVSARVRELLLRMSPLQFKGLELGNLTLTAGSQHLYERNFAGAEEVLVKSSERYIEEVFSPHKIDSIIKYLDFMKDYHPETHAFHLHPEEFLNELFCQVYGADKNEA